MHLLQHSLFFLYHSLIKHHNYPIIVYHDDIDNDSQNKLIIQLGNLIKCKMQITFEKVDFVLPDFISTDNQKYNPPLSQFRMGYRHMCRWFSGEIYKHPSLQDYEWYMRLDSDSFLLSAFKNDIFEEMEEKNLTYAYMSELDKDEDFVVGGLFETTKQYAALNNLPLTQTWNREMYYTNFEIGKLQFFRSSEYQKYYNYIDQNGGIYYSRWGDAPIRWLALNMLLSQEAIHCIKDVCYQHGTWVKNVASMNRTLTNFVPEPYRTWALSAK
jgi:hypothetical protein